jgi:hypothetical protein
LELEIGIPKHDVTNDNRENKDVNNT